jgi:cellulose synthase/poly-beta-1,6-N-acetylglucosamine synthase-like glycosyltransferase
MFVTLLYLSSVVILWWCIQGYFLYLFWRKTGLPEKKATENYNTNIVSDPISFSIIIPTYNEKDLINQKITNLKALIYPDYHVYFSDVSDDGTDVIISSAIAGYPNYSLIRIDKPGRSIQINKALSLINHGIVVVTDADALCEPDVLQKLADIFLDKTIGVVGGYVQPVTKYKTDISFWKVQNTARLTESACGLCPVVAGACYAFRREIVNEIPQDVWAEDIYIPFMAHLKGFYSIYSSEIPVKETRAPKGFDDFFKIKIRKAHDNIKELTRFLPEILTMPKEWLIVYITRFVQIMASPFLIILFLLSIFFQGQAVLIFSVSFLFLSGIIQKFLLNRISKEKLSILETMKTFIITELVLLYAVLFFLFRKRKISYTKLGTITNNENISH